MVMCHKHTKPWQEVHKEDCPYCKISDYERTYMLSLQAKVGRMVKALEYVAYYGLDDCEKAARDMRAAAKAALEGKQDG